MDTILVILPDPAQSYTDILAGIRRRLSAQLRVQIVDYKIDRTILNKLLNFWQPCGCIVAAAEGVSNIPHAAFRKTPVVYLDRTPLAKGIYLDVCQDYEENGKLAAQELLQPDIQNYAYVAHKTRANWSAIRGKAFVQSIELHGKRCHVFDEVIASGNRYRLLESWLCALPKPVGVFTANDRTAGEVRDICLRNGISIPDDISLLGIDNELSTCESTESKITSILPDFEKSGWLCADLLLERLANPRMKTALRKYGTLGIIDRGSTHRHLTYSRQVLNAISTIRARAYEGISVDDVAAAMGCSRRMAERRFLQSTGETIKHALTTVRLDRAQTLLKNPCLSLRDICSACGYKTENALRIAFRKKFKKPLSSFVGRKREC